MKTTALSIGAATWLAVTLASPAATAGNLYTFTTIDGPNPGSNDGEMTFVQAISDTHLIVGYAFPDSTCTNSFMFDNNTPITLNIPVPNNWPGPVCIRAEGVNNSGHVVGTYGDTVVQGNGFLYHNGAFSSFGTVGLPPFPLPRTMPKGISNSGLIVGNYQDTEGEHAFIDISGYRHEFDIPGALSTYAHGINDFGRVAGTYLDATGSHGYLYYWGSFRRLNYPGGRETMAHGINDFGITVGSYEDAAGGLHGFVYQGGAFAPFDVPFGSGTVLTGINNRGQIVGSYDLLIGNKPRHGFVANPVTLLNLATGVVRYKAASVRATIHSTTRFDAVADIDVSSLTFGRSGDEGSLMSCEVSPSRFGSGNLTCTFSVPMSGISCGDKRVFLNGRLRDGTAIRGSDDVQVRPCR